MGKASNLFCHKSCVANRLEVAEYKQERDSGDLEDVENHFSLAEIRMERKVVRGKKLEMEKRINLIYLEATTDRIYRAFLPLCTQLKN